MKKDEEKVEVIFDDPKEINGPYLSFYDNEKKSVRYIPTTEEMFHKVRNIRRDAERREQKDVYYEVRYGEDDVWVRQKEKPSDKEYYVDYKVVPPASLDYLKDEYDLEFAYPNESSRYGVDSDWLVEQIEKILTKASEIERAIFKLSFFEHKNDTEIALLVFNDKKKRTSVCKQKEEIRYFVACHLKRLLNRD